jgi:hypothetical protein
MTEKVSVGEVKSNIIILHLYIIVFALFDKQHICSLRQGGGKGGGVDSIVIAFHPSPRDRKSMPCRT